MDAAVLVQRLCHIKIWRLLVIMGTVVAFLAVSQGFALTIWKTIPLSPASKGSIPKVAHNVTVLNNSRPNRPFAVNIVEGKDTYASDSHKEAGYENETKETDKQDKLASDYNPNSHKEVKVEKDYPQAITNLTLGGVQNPVGILPFVSEGISSKGMGNFCADSRTLFFADNISTAANVEPTTKMQPKHKKTRPMQSVSITQMSSLLQKSHVSSWSTVQI